jgi:hypothetical protein
MISRNRDFAILVVLFIIAPGIHFFLSGENHLVPVLRSYLVAAQILVGLVLAYWFWNKKRQERD